MAAMATADKSMQVLTNNFFQSLKVHIHSWCFVLNSRSFRSILLLYIECSCAQGVSMDAINVIDEDSEAVPSIYLFIPSNFFVIC